MKRKLNEHGLATFEMGLFSVLLLTLLTGVLAACDFLSYAMLIRRVIDSYIVADTVKPLLLSSDTAHIAPIVNEEGELGMKAFLQSQLLRISSELNLTETVKKNGSSAYYIEAAYSDIVIDPATGEYLSLGAHRYSIAIGALAVPSELLETTDLEHEFQHLAASHQAGGEASLVAIPSALFGVSMIPDQYLDTTVLVGLRIFISLENTFAGRIFQQFGASRFVYDFKTTVLRGEFG